MNLELELSQERYLSMQPLSYFLNFQVLQSRASRFFEIFGDGLSENRICDVFKEVLINGKECKVHSI